ncbi:MAG: hypothetical protein H7A33_07405 [Deltaproteobacteria bacterium]|nr:hypothetical protein [Deltaproteobacteria bacterium]
MPTKSSYQVLEEKLKATLFPNGEYTELPYNYGYRDDIRDVCIKRMIQNARALDEEGKKEFVRFVFLDGILAKNAKAQRQAEYPHWVFLEDLCKHDALYLLTWTQLVEQNKQKLLALPGAYQGVHWHSFAASLGTYQDHELVKNSSYLNVLHELALTSKMAKEVMAALFYYDRDWVYENLEQICTTTPKVLDLLVTFIQRHKEDKSKWIPELLKCYSKIEILKQAKDHYFVKKHISEWEDFFSSYSD